MGRAYHNTTAHYNSYFLAREKMKETDKQVWDAHKDDYNKIIEVLPIVTKETKGVAGGNLEDIIKKAALPIKRHRNSKWVDDSYILVGKSRFYGGEWQLAIETFKYVNAKSKEPDSRHKALTLLMKTFVDSGSAENANAVYDYLKKQKLSKENRRDFYLNYAYHLSKTEQYKEMVPYLNEAVPDMKYREEKARIYFILGQIYQQLGFDKEANDSYKLCIKNNPPYELSFFAKLNLAQVTSVAKEKEKKKIEKNFRKMLKDLKNVEYRDRIFYEMGIFEIKQSNYDKGIALLEKSVRENGKTKGQKGRTYLRLGKLYYETLKKYELASAYYDSTVTQWDTKDKDYKAISERQKILKDFVVQINIVTKEDSLQRLAKMDSASLAKFIDKIVADEEKKQKELQEALAKAAKKAENNDTGGAGNPFALNNEQQDATASTGRVWYFYNPSAINIGRNEFVKRWGKRPLEDNWRRSTKEATVQDPNAAPILNAENNTSTAAEAADKDSLENALPKIDRMQYYKEIPFTTEQLTASNKRLDEAMYNLGKIYNQKLNEQDNAIKTFDHLLERSPDFIKEAEVLYFLYLIYKDQKNSKEEIYKNRILTEFPASLYAKLIRNPNYLADSKIANQQVDLLYRDAYALYNANQFESADSAITNIRKQYPENEIEERLTLLHILIVGKTKNALVYKSQLGDFIKKYKAGPLNEKAKELLAAADSYIEGKTKKNVSIDSLGIRYNNEVDKINYFGAAFSVRTSSKIMLNRFKAFNNQNFNSKKLKAETVPLTDSTYIVIIKEFADKNDAKRYLIGAKNEKPLLSDQAEEQYSLFLITDTNLKLLLKSRNLNNYLEFFRDSYQ